MKLNQMIQQSLRSITNILTNISRRSDILKAKIEKINNKFFVELPDEVIKALNIKSNDDLQVLIKDDKIVLEDKENSEMSLEDRLDYYSSKNLIKKYDWGKV